MGAEQHVAVSLRTTSHKGHLQAGLIAATIVAAAAAVLPIVFAIAGGIAAPGSSGTAFATAPPGQYAVVSRTEGTEDIIAVAPLTDPANAREVTRVKHLNGFAATGAVSPDGRQLAVVAPDGGTAAHPFGSLLAIALESGKQTRLLSGIDPQQTPVWANDSASIVVTAPSIDSSGMPGVRFVSVAVSGGEQRTLYQPGPVLGAYAVGFDPAGRFVAVVIDGRGSTLVRAETELQLLSTQITRDWRLSPDGRQIAFIESDLNGGLHYVPRVAVLGHPVTGEAQVASPGQALGTAWKPGSDVPTFGREDSGTSAGSANAQVVAGPGHTGIDVPLGYSRDGRGLVVNHWSGSSFGAPGKVTLEVVADGARSSLAAYGKFLGWAQR